MAYVLADNIISPLGNTSEENYQQVKAGKSGIRTYEPRSHGIPEGFTASLLPDKEQSVIVKDDVQGLPSEGTKLTFKHGDFEHLAIASAKLAMEQASMPSSAAQTSETLDWSSDRVAFILSSTKGAIESSGNLSSSAQRIAQRLGITTTPIVVCNACISGLSALILGSRLIEEGKYDYAVVCGVDCPDRFIISGFQSLKALSTIPCRPFDIERFGLNLGEAAATMVLGKDARLSTKEDSTWQIGNGFVKNDAFHISAPSKTAEGLYAALSETLSKTYLHDLAFINAHGTATLFNDQMESIAIERAGLSSLPTNALKGYFGHTLGAAGILETIISMKAIDDHTILGTRGFEELGVSGKVNVSAVSLPTDKHAFIKMLSGFGGCNATLWASKENVHFPTEERSEDVHFLSNNLNKSFTRKHSIKITPEEIVVDGQQWGKAPSLTALYKQYIGDYPKFYKMDGLSRLGFIASEILLQQESEKTRAEVKEESHAFDRGIVLFNHSSSIASDRKYLASIANPAEYFPSPSVFVYTLPNIVTGEIAMRHGYHGETSFYILPHNDQKLMNEILNATFLDPATQSILGGWLDYEDEEHFEAELCIISTVTL